MAAFHFEFEHVLEQRRREEREKQRAVAVLDRERLELEESLRRQQGVISGAKSDLRAALEGERAAEGVGVLRIQDVRLQSTASLHATLRAQGCVLKLAGVHKRLDAARRELLDATCRRKAVELLRTRRYEQWKRLEERREAAQLDDIVTNRWGRASKTAEEMF